MSARTFGSLKLMVGAAPRGRTQRAWFMELDPHVAIRARRVFGRLAGQLGTMRVADSLDVRKDLLWFTERYPLLMSTADRAELERGAADFDARAAEVFALTRGAPPRPFDLAVPPRDYQRAAADIVLRTGSLLLADQLGLGKTCSAICVLSDVHARPGLVVTLTHLPEQWAAEIQRFTPGLRVHVVTKTTPYDLASAPIFGSKRRRRIPFARGPQQELPIEGAGAMPDVIVMSYSKLFGWAEALKGFIKTVVFDEAQELRSAGTQKHNAAKLLAGAADYRMGLSGTPIYNYGGEIHTVLECIAPGALGTRHEFLTEWCGGDSGGPNDKPSLKDPAAFGLYARELGLLLRRTAADVGMELPGVTRVLHAIETEDPIGEDADVAALARFILSKSGSPLEVMKASGELDWKMRQATGIAKAPQIAAFVRMLAEDGEQVLLYGWHRAVYDRLERDLADLKPVFFTGEESGPQKRAAVAAFKSGESRVLVMSLRAGAGIDGLQQVCRTVVFGELDWSPGVMEQCLGRVDRSGQTRPVMAYYVVANTGADPVMVDTLGLKSSQIAGIRSPSGGEKELFKSLEVDGSHIRKLAMSVLVARGAADEVTKSLDKAPRNDVNAGNFA